MRRTAMVVLIALVAVAAATTLTLWWYHDEISAARAEAGRGGRIVHTTAGIIEYAEKGAGIPLLSIHGAGGGYDQGLANVAGLVGDGFRVIAPSRFGYLSTPIPSDTSPAAQADAHAALLHALNVDRAIVVGFSAGTRSALELALRHPDQVAALILIVPATYSPTDPVAVEASRGSKFVFWRVNSGADFVWWAADKLAPSLLIRFVGVRPELVAASPQAEQNRVRAIVRAIAPLSLRFAGINLDSVAALSPLPLEKITAPTLVISARDDLFNTLPAAEHAARNIRAAKLIVYESGGHLLVGRQREASEAVRAFLVAAGLAAPGHAKGSAP